MPRHAQNRTKQLVPSSEKVVAWNVDDITPARVPIVQKFELRLYTTIFEPLRRTSAEHTRMFEEKVEKMLSAGILRPSSSLWGFAVVIFAKKNSGV